MNEELNKHVNDDEIEKVVFSIRASVFSGPVGIASLIFHIFWKYIGPQVSAEVKPFFIATA